MWISSSGRCSHRGVDVDAVVVVTKVVDVVPPDDVVVVVVVAMVDDVNVDFVVRPLFSSRCRRRCRGRRDQ
eukprot:SAG11_NODE_26787_length_340_cov_4.510373_1_plen_70_part_01